MPKVVVDRIQIEQVITNLVRNAVEAIQEIPSEKRIVAIRTSLRQPGLLEVAVEDTGKGLRAEDVGRLFEPFYTTKQSGMGLGLSISRSLVESHEGRLEVDARQAQGTIFRFTLPALGAGESA